MNSLKLRLANIAFKVLKAELVLAKHWKTEDEIYTQEQWDKYLEERIKRPKFVPIIVPNVEKQKAAEQMRDELRKKGMSMDKIKDKIEKQYSGKGMKRTDTKEKMDAEWKRRAQESKRERDKRHRENKKIKLQQHKENARKLNSEGMFVYDGQTRRKEKVGFILEGADIYDMTMHTPLKTQKGKKTVTLKGKFTEEEEDQLKNQLMQFRKDKPNVNRRRRSDQQLKQEFLSKMDPAGYENPKAFMEAKTRIQQMNPHDFMAMVRSIFSEVEDDEEEVVVQQPKKTRRTKKDEGFEQLSLFGKKDTGF